MRTTSTTCTTGIGIRRRQEAMAAMGWPLAEQARHANLTLHQYVGLPRRAVIDDDTAKAINEVYDRCTHPAPHCPGSRQARQTARRLGYLPPLAWDEHDGTRHDIDDPDAVPVVLPPVELRLNPDDDDEHALYEMWSSPGADELAIQRWYAGSRTIVLNRITRDELVFRLFHNGWSTDQLGRSLGLRRSRVSQLLTDLRRGRNDYQRWHQWWTTRILEETHA